MRPLLTGAEMREMETRYFRETGTSSIVLMEKAARALAEEVLRLPGESVAIAVGAGGNGGDGYAAARILAGAGRRVVVAAAADAASPDAAANRGSLPDAVRLLPTGELPDFRPDVWVDALLGIGISRSPEGVYADFIGRMMRDREAGSLVISADIPSGLDADGGLRFPNCVTADATVAFQAAKWGHYLGDGPDVCGQMLPRDIGIPGEFLPAGAAQVVEQPDLAALFGSRRRASHKGDYGHLLVVAGSLGMAGAASLCAGGALRAGAGLVTLACPVSVVPIVQTLRPTAMCLPLPERDGAIAPEAAEVIRRALAGKRAVAVGCGLGNAAPEAVLAAVDSDLPTVIDADGLNITARTPVIRRRLGRNHILTPHPGEAARLMGRSVTDPVADARELAAFGGVALLKGNTTVISGRETFANVFGTPGMARGGSGDVLTGIIGAFLASHPGEDPARLAALASAAAGLAGEAAARKKSVTAMLPTDEIEELPGVFLRCENGEA